MKNLLIAIVVLAGCASAQTRIAGKEIAVEFDAQMHSRVVAYGNQAIGPMSPSEVIVANGRTVADFAMDSQQTEGVQDGVGKGNKLVAAGRAGTLLKTVAVTVYDDFPNAAVFEVSYRNAGTSPVEMSSWTNNR